MDPEAPPLPIGQLCLMVFSWFSFFLYIHLVTIILRDRRLSSPLSSPFYIIIVSCSIGDFAMFFHIELVMRPRKYRFLGFFDSSTPVWFAYYSYFLSAYLRTVMQLSYIPMAVNRFTAFSMPFQYKKIWKNKFIALYTVIIWLLALALTVNLFLWENVDMRWTILVTGVMQTLANRYFYLDAILSTSVSISCCLFCLAFYALGAFFAAKSQVEQHNEVEKRLFGCSLLASVPLLIESLKSLAVLYATVQSNQSWLVYLTELWFYWTEFMTSSQCWSVLLVTPHIRKLIVESGLFGMLTRKSSSHVISTSSISQRPRYNNR